MRAWFVTAVLVAVALSPMLSSTLELDEVTPTSDSSPLQATVSPSSGWTSGGEGITIAGSGFLAMADRNVSYDGINHQWTKSTADYADESGPENAIVVDSNGHVHIVYINGGNYKIMHAEHDGTNWHTQEVDTCPGSYCWDAHMVIDDNNELHVAYSSQGEKLVYQHYDGQDWNGGVVSSSARFAPVGIAVDSNNLPHISYSQTGQWCGNGLRLASFDGSVWTTQSVDSGTNKGCDSSIVIDENDYVYIAYQDRDNSKLKFATNKSGSWLSYSPDESSFGNNMYPGYSTSLAMDKQGQFHIAHYDSDNEDLRYSTGRPNGQWTNTIVDASGDTGKNPSIAVDAAGDLHIVYASWSGFDLKYATLKPSSSSSWQKSNIQTQDMVGDSNAIFIDDNGMIHVAYSDDSNDVLKYATKSTGVVVTDEITVQFGQLGTVTGSVVDDNTITATTPSVTSPGNETVSLIDNNGDEHTLASTFEFIDQNDLDGDGVANAIDDCPNDAGDSTLDQVGCPDDDGDGYSNAGDAFPSDVNEWVDSDGDGVGNNADAFPNDATETMDSDGDGVGDNADAFPMNALEQVDSDGDGVGDNADAFPSNPYEWEDLDGNQIPDNSEPSKIRITASNEDLRIHPYHISGNNLTLTLEAITSEGFTIISLESEPSGILPNTGGLPYGMIGGGEQHISLRSLGLMEHVPLAFYSGEYITEIDPWINFTVYVTGVPHGCEAGEQYWDAQQQSSCPTRIANHRTDYYANFSMMLWNGDDDNDGVPNSWDLFPLDANETKDSDGDGVGDNADAFPNDANETADTDGDGVGDNADQCPGSEEGVTVDENGCVVITDSDGDGVIDGDDLCPDENASLLDEDEDGCLDDEDGDGILDSDDACPLTELDETVDETGCSEGQLSVLDEDNDGVSNLDDLCPETPANVSVDATGCALEGSVEDGESSSFLGAFFSGESDPVTTSVGLGAVLIALIGLLQTNAVAAILPDAFRWVQVLRKNSKLTKEEENELTYLQSLTQAYFTNPQELAEELEQLRGDLTARYTNNEIKKQTREKLMTLVDDLLASTPEQLSRIAHNDAYFGLAGTIDPEHRTLLLNEKLTMAATAGSAPSAAPTASPEPTPASTEPAITARGTVKDDGYEWLELPEGSSTWYYRTAHSRTSWTKWQ